MHSVLITGALGGIGQALCAEFTSAGWRVIATDDPSIPHPRRQEFPIYLPNDLRQFKKSAPHRAKWLKAVREASQGAPLKCVVNNAAAQRLGDTASATVEDWDVTLDVNLVAPFLLVQAFIAELTHSRGSVINIASIHAQLTKPGFVAYATSKAGIAGLTRALAVDLGKNGVRVNAISPAAISTPMLEAGFEGRPKARKQLDEYHPSARIGTPGEVARLAVFLASDAAAFMNGSCVGIDGALGARLHDPI